MPVFAFRLALVPLSLLLSVLILMHRGRGGGMTGLFGADSGTSGVAERNLDRITVVAGVLWLACIVAADLPA